MLAYINTSESIKADIDSLITGFKTISDHFNGIIESLITHQEKNHTIIANAQTTTADLISTSEIMSAVANDALEFENKLPAFQESINQIKDLSERLAIIVINAAIQSSHAGPFGKSFKVITEEVAKLNAHIQNTLLPQQESFIKEKIIPTIARTTANTKNGNQRLQQDVASLKQANELSLSIAESLDGMIEGIREVKETIDAFLDNLMTIQSHMATLIVSLKAIPAIPSDLLSAQNIETSTMLITPTINPTTKLESMNPILHKASETKIMAQTHQQLINWIEYKGKKILYFDFSNYTLENEAELILKLNEAANIYKTIPDNNLLVISNVTNCINSQNILEGFKALRAAGKGRIKHSVLVGATGMRKLQASLLGAIAGKLTLVKTLEEAKEFIAAN